MNFLEAIRAPLDPESEAALIVESMPLVLFLVDEFVTRGCGSKEYLRQDLIAEGNLALVLAVRTITLKTEPSIDGDYFRNFLCASIRGAVSNYALKTPRGYSVRTLKRREADGINIDCPATQALTAFIDVIDPRSNHEAVTDLLDAIDHACADDIDRNIVDLKMNRGFSNEDCARFLASLPEGQKPRPHLIQAVYKRLRRILRRMDEQQ